MLSDMEVNNEILFMCITLAHIFASLKIFMIRFGLSIRINVISTAIILARVVLPFAPNLLRPSIPTEVSASLTAIGTLLITCVATKS